jgi:hypothetical protein
MASSVSVMTNLSVLSTVKHAASLYPGRGIGGARPDFSGGPAPHPPT